MAPSVLIQESTSSIEIVLLLEQDYRDWFEKSTSTIRSWLEKTAFRPSSGSLSWLPLENGETFVLMIWKGADALTALMSLPFELPEGNYRLTSTADAKAQHQFALGWGMAGYQYQNYKKANRAPAHLLIPKTCDANLLQAQIKATTLARDLINTPASDMLPSHLAKAALAFKERHAEVQIDICIDQELLERGYRNIYTVGQASTDRPRLIDMRWGKPNHPRITLIGKGVCFDSGGLDLKPASGMRQMKKDMGGAAQVLGLAELIIAQRLPIQLRVLIPAVENAVSGNAFRPGDVIKSYKGLTIEIGNTDAEGRLVLSDALTLACEEKPELVLDFATLTGAARVALGTDLPALFCNHDVTANAILDSATHINDPLWRMPLHQPYLKYIKSNIADLSNTASVPTGGAITAALFLQQFVDADTPWAHIDLMAFNNSSSPGHPEGGEAMGLRAVYDYLATKYV